MRVLYNHLGARISAFAVVTHTLGRLYFREVRGDDVKWLHEYGTEIVEISDQYTTKELEEAWKQIH